mmetsp:Transcript_7735/g.13271  ORF Transcript_7735/g.13271 Transcript_7735/m.13271 type:complete len:234 (+) Transcript_7735:553-1254(+)
MQQPLLVGEELDEGAEAGDGLDGALVRVAQLRHHADALDRTHRPLARLVVRAAHLNHRPLVVLLHNHDLGASLFLDALYGLAALADDGAHELTGNWERLDARHKRLHGRACLVLALVHTVQDVRPAALRLSYGFPEQMPVQAAHLDVHLARGQSCRGTGELEVHVPEGVLVAQDVGQDGVAPLRCAGGVDVVVVAELSVRVGADETHGNTGHGTSKWDSSVEQGQRGGAHCRH